MDNVGTGANVHTADNECKYKIKMIAGEFKYMNINTGNEYIYKIKMI